MGKITGEIKQGKILVSNWCIVDALNFNKAGLMRQRLDHQIRMADKVLLNKADLVENVDELHHEIRGMNPFAEIKTTTFCNVDFLPGDSVVPKGIQKPSLITIICLICCKKTPKREIKFLLRTS